MKTLVTAFSLELPDEGDAVGLSQWRRLVIGEAGPYGFKSGRFTQALREYQRLLALDEKIEFFVLTAPCTHTVSEPDAEKRMNDRVFDAARYRRLLREALADGCYENQLGFDKEWALEVAETAGYNETIIRTADEVAVLKERCTAGGFGRLVVCSNSGHIERALCFTVRAFEDTKVHICAVPAGVLMPEPVFLERWHIMTDTDRVLPEHLQRRELAKRLFFKSTATVENRERIADLADELES